MSETSTSAHHSHRKTYVIIFLVLVAATLFEIFVPGMSIAYKVKATLITTIAIIKAFLVAYFFMHLNEETRWMKFIACIPICAVFYALFLVVESIVR
jgi:cytochrome c oxidase subunit 4